MTEIFSQAFDACVAEGDTITAEHEGFTLTATIHRDDNATPPWDREDGHGPVSTWRPRDSKRAGERVLSEDRRSCRFYDFAEACKIALRDGWGVKGGRKEGETAKAYAARAAEADFQNLRAWCNDEWFYCGVAVTVERDGVELTGEYDHALWGVDCNHPAGSSDYLREVANDLAPQALDAARAKLAEISGTDAAPAMLSALELAEGWIDAHREDESTGEGQQAAWILATVRAAIEQGKAAR